MKIKIFTEGGLDAGLGHISRCISLYTEISRREILVDFIIDGDVQDIDFLKGINFKNENWMDEKYLTNNISQDDFVIVDSYKAKKIDYDTIVKISKRVLFIDDNGRINYPKGIIVNPAIDASSIDYSQINNNTVLSGPDFIIVRSPFIGAKKENVFNGIKKILITMGGTDVRNITPLLINEVCKNKLDIEFDIVIGSKKSDHHYNQLSKNGNITIHSNIDAIQMMELMVKSDLAITAAGQTIYELLCTQTLFIPIQVIDNQENNIKSLLKYNPSQIYLKYNDKDLVNRILATLDIYDNGFYGQEQSNKYKGLVDGYGSKRIIDKLLEEL